MAQTEDVQRLQEESSDRTLAKSFLYLAYFAVSALAIIPCIWLPEIEAGDLASHLYNIWLIQMLRDRPVPGLELHWQWTNVLFDHVLELMSKVVGLFVAEKLTVILCVLLFFWGVFRFCTVIGGNRPWRLLPAILMVSYGLTFNMGFMNYYLSVALAFWIMALYASDAARNKWLALLLLPLTVYAHYLGFMWACCGMAYLSLMRQRSKYLKVSAIVLAMTGIIGLRVFLFHRFLSAAPAGAWYQRTGLDQLILGGRFAWIAYSFFVLFLISVFITLWTDKKAPRDVAMIGGLYLILTLGAMILPNAVFLPQYQAPAGFLTLRITLLAFVVLLALWATVRVPVWASFACSLLAVLFFFNLWKDQRFLNAVEAQTFALTREIPPGTRFITTVLHVRSGIIFEHFYERACIGRCFIYSNYEASTGQFQLRATAPNPVVIWNERDSRKMDEGAYVIQPEDLPVFRLGPCHDGRPHICAAELKPGDRNGP